MHGPVRSRCDVSHSSLTALHQVSKFEQAQHKCITWAYTNTRHAVDSLNVQSTVTDSLISPLRQASVNHAQEDECKQASYDSHCLFIYCCIRAYLTVLCCEAALCFDCVERRKTCCLDIQKSRRFPDPNRSRTEANELMF